MLAEISLFCITYNISVTIVHRKLNYSLALLLYPTICINNEDVKILCFFKYFLLLLRRNAVCDDSAYLSIQGLKGFELFNIVYKLGIEAITKHEASLFIRSITDADEGLLAKELAAHG